MVVSASVANRYSRTTFGVAIILALLCLSIFIYVGNMQRNTKTLSIRYGSHTPYSADPLDYDAFVHHMVFRSVFGTLVSLYKAGDIAPQLASSWKSSNDRLEWTFNIRPGLVFENGEEISALSFVRSFTRLAFLLKQRKSSSDFFDHLRGIENLKAPDSQFAGLVADGQKLILRFQKAPDKLLETLSFGLYGLAHPSNWDLKTGTWIDPHKSIASSAYKVAEWTDKHLVLNKRDNFPDDYGHPNKPTQVDLIFADRPDFSSVDLAGGASIDHPPSGFKFLQGSSFYILFLRCFSWAIKSSPFHSKLVRQNLRTQFYRFLKAQGTTPKRSFFPLIINGIEENTDVGGSQSLPENRLIRVRYRNAFSDSENINKAMAQLETLGLKIEGVSPDVKTVMKELDSNLSTYSFDLSPFMTGILVESPLEDIRFMFKSAEGIRLPDATGEILKELEKEKPDLGKVNQMLWDQAIIWPLDHFTMGLWYRDHIDVSMLNPSMPPIDFAWIGQKD